MQPVRVANQDARYKIEIWRIRRAGQGARQKQEPGAMAAGQEGLRLAREMQRETGEGKAREAVSKG